MLADGSTDERLMHTHAVAVCNGHTFGGGMLIGPEARPDDGLLQVVSFETRTKLQARPALPHDLPRHPHARGGREQLRLPLRRADARRRRAYERGSRARRPRRDGRRVRGARAGAAHGVFPLDIDGDARGDVPLRVELLPGALLVRA